MQEPPWMPRTEEEYRQQLAEDAGPQSDEMVRVQMALDATEEEVARLQMQRDANDREMRRLREQVRIAEEVLNLIARCGCSACGPALPDTRATRSLADDALTRMDTVE